jgi:hypothetical protein
MESIEKLTKYTKIFNQDSAEYKNLIGDKNKLDVLVSGTVKINDYDNGTIGNVFQYETDLFNFLVDQLDLSKAQDSYLDYIVDKYYGYRRNKNETDLEFYTRVLGLIFDPKGTPRSIVKAIQEFGTDIQIVEGLNIGAFADLTYADYYSDTYTGGVYVRPAFTGYVSGSPYFFRILISNLLAQNYKKLIEKINEYKVAGVNYVVEVLDTIAQYIGFSDLMFCNYDEKDFTVNPIIVYDFTN